MRVPWGIDWEYLEECRYRQEYSVYSKIKKRIKILEIALGKGEQVSDEIQKEKRKLSEISKHWPLGDNPAFAILCISCIITIAVTIHLYLSFYNLLEELWESPENPYLQDYRSESACVWSCVSSLLSNPKLAFFILILLVILFVILWHIQKKLHRINAAFLLKIIFYIVVILGVLINSAWLRLCMFTVDVMP